jgi:putative transposase
MPWTEETVTDQRVRFVRDFDKYVRSGAMSMSELCRQYGIARKTGYKMVRRRDDGGWPALADQSRAPHSGPHWTDDDLIMRVLETRIEFPHWGAETILAYLHRHEPHEAWPSASAIHGWLKQAELVTRQRRPRRFPHPGRPPATVVDHPNQTWTVDFKGHFRTGDRRYCYPLTVADSFSRFLIGCRALPSTAFDLVWPVFERLFREYGLPDSILSDNGSPFSSNSVRRLSKLSVRWIRLGITPILIQPGKPQQNGRHERMHGHMMPLCDARTENLSAQQKLFDWFVHHNNHIRPHAGIGRKVPADLYEKSSRPYPRRLPQIEYPSHFEVRRVRSSGEIRWDGQWFFVSEALVGEQIAFEEVDDSCWIVRFGPLDLGYYSSRDRRLHLDRVRPGGKAENAPAFPTFPQAPPPKENT